MVPHFYRYILHNGIHGLVYPQIHYARVSLGNHKDHHKKDHDSWFERNDAFFLYYAAVSMAFIMIASNSWFWYGYPIGFGIMAYGASYFLVHDIFIHQRFKLFRKANNWYARGVRRAHKIHHKNIHKEGGECFGMLFVPFKYFKKS